jgi:hypothetical protein
MPIAATVALIITLASSAFAHSQQRTKPESQSFRRTREFSSISPMRLQECQTCFAPSGGRDTVTKCLWQLPFVSGFPSF